MDPQPRGGTGRAISGKPQLHRGNFVHEPSGQLTSNIAAGSVASGVIAWATSRWARPRQDLSHLRAVPASAASRGIDTMKAKSSGRDWTGPEFRISVSFGVPLDFAFAWCTDYTPEDASLEGESYQRKIIERTPRRVIFEDLEESDDDAARGALDDLSLVRLPLQARVLGRIVGAPGERKVERNPERDADAKFGTRPVPTGTLCFHGVDASASRLRGNGPEVR